APFSSRTTRSSPPSAEPPGAEDNAGPGEGGLSGAVSRSRPGGRWSEASSQGHDQDDQEDQAQGSAGKVAPTGAIGPSGQGPYQEQDQHDQQNSSQCSLTSPGSLVAADRPAWRDGPLGRTATGSSGC